MSNLKFKPWILAGIVRHTHELTVVEKYWENLVLIFVIALESKGNCYYKLLPFLQVCAYSLLASQCMFVRHLPPLKARPKSPEQLLLSAMYTQNSEDTHESRHQGKVIHVCHCKFVVRVQTFEEPSKPVTPQLPHVQLCKRKSRNSLNLTFNLNTLYLNTSILFTLLKFTCVNVRSQKRVSGNLTLRMCHGRVYTGSFALNYPRTLLAAPPPPWVGGTAIYGLYRYVPLWRV